MTIDRAAARKALMAMGRRYWPRAAELVAGRAELIRAAPADPKRDDMTMVALPPWAHDLVPDGADGLLVPTRCLEAGKAPAWTRCDWWTAMADMLFAGAEREGAMPPTSYAARLPKHVDRRRFDRAWVNRIMLFLRRWAAYDSEQDERALFGPVPAATFDFTHDVDAVAKTKEIRFKQAMFHRFNAVRGAAKLDFTEMRRCLERARIMRNPDGDYWCFDEIMELEESFDIRSTFHFHAGDLTKRSRKTRLIDPGYDVRDGRLRTLFMRLRNGGWTVGVHPGYDHFADADAIGAECDRLEAAASARPTRVRQHWLRFAWEETFRAHVAAGLTLDTTVGFNDRPGFRVSAALRYHPLILEDPETEYEEIPLVLMDSHLYDYGRLDDTGRRHEIAKWINEVHAVGGDASIVWHQRVMHPDYGWRAGYEETLRAALRRG